MVHNFGWYSPQQLDIVSYGFKIHPIYAKLQREVQPYEQRDIQFVEGEYSTHTSNTSR